MAIMIVDRTFSCTIVLHYINPRLGSNVSREMFWRGKITQCIVIVRLSPTLDTLSSPFLTLPFIIIHERTSQPKKTTIKQRIISNICLRAPSIVFARPNFSVPKNLASVMKMFYCYLFSDACTN